MKLTEDNDKRSSQLDKMREGRLIANAAYINFTSNYAKFLSHVFCFYEGEDGKYYNQRIKTILGNEIIPIKTGNKSETLKVWRKIKSDSDYDHTNKMFFVDRDFDEIPEDKDDDLYITPCYSIENLYVNCESLGDIIQSEFSCNKINNDYQKCIDKFNELYFQFNNLMIEFNALVLLRNRKKLGNGNVRLCDIKTHQMIDIQMNGIKKGDKYITIINELKTKLDITKNELDAALREIVERGQFNHNFRGKNQLDFMVAFINLLKKLHNDNSFFESRQQSVSINITGNRLSELSQYADFPQCLKEFINKHRFAS